MDAISNEENKKPKLRGLTANSWIGVILIALAGLSLWQAIQQALTRDLTGLETTLFSSITFVLSSVGSFIVSAHFSQSQARKEYEQLARPALRRVDSLHQAVTLVASGVAERTTTLQSNNGGKSENQEELIWLRGLTTQLQLLSHTIRDATSDWRELLPDDYEDALRRAFEDIGSSKEAIVELQKQIESQRAKQTSGDKNAKETIGRLELELEKERQAAKARSYGLLEPNAQSSWLGRTYGHPPVFTAWPSPSDPKDLK